MVLDTHRQVFGLFQRETLTSAAQQKTGADLAVFFSNSCLFLLQATTLTPLVSAESVGAAALANFKQKLQL